MDSHRYRRPGSPPGGRRIVDPMRSSTGTVGGYPLYDSYHHPSRVSRDFVTSPRSSGDRIFESDRAIPRSYKIDSSQTPALRGAFRRPRRSTLDPADGTGRPALVPPRSPVGGRPVIHAGGRDRVISPVGRSYNAEKDGDYFVTPATSGRRSHRRQFSVEADDIDRSARPNGRSDSVTDRPFDRPGYRAPAVAPARKGYHLSGPLVRHPDVDDGRYGYDASGGYGYGYTDPQDDGYREKEVGRRRGNSFDPSRRERPLSMIELERSLPQPSEPKELGPPPSTRGFDRIGKPGRSSSIDRSSRTVGRSGSVDRAPRALPDEAPYEYPLKARDDEPLESGRSLRRRPAVLHQDYDNSYPPYREDQDEYREKDRGRRYEGDVERRGTGLRGSRDDSADPYSSHDEDGGGRHHRRRPRHRDDDRDEKGGRGRDDREHELGGRDPREERELRDRDPRERSDRDAERDRDGLKGEGRDKGRRDRDVGPERDPRDWERRDRDKLEREARELRDRREREEQERALRTRDSRESRDSHEEPEHRELDINQRDPKERGRPKEEGERTNRVRVVSPPGEKESKAPIKGILRPPREKFPEDPTPVREGVAPLKEKEGEKKNIPPGAKWTKIDRKLVNPAALEEGNERFEERPDHVVVLRVLTREDIEAYAARTQQIRGMPPKEADAAAVSAAKTELVSP
ncbi:MAG: hypothetical protein M1837_002935 [Sclerophora amabilis]|nr:MAG: hypothetical protein M1837_002935 [Sclerophora amabilis]